MHALTVAGQWESIPYWQSVRRSAVAVDGLDVVVVWTDRTGSGSLWAKRSTDGGLTWPTPPVRLDIGFNVFTDASAPRLLAEGQLLQVFWGQTNLANVNAIAQQESTDGGVTWLAVPRMVAAPSQMNIRAVTRNGNDLMLARDYEVPLRSTDGGATWSPTVVPWITTLFDLANSGPVIVAVGTVSPISSAPPTYVVNTSLDGGLTWQANPWAASSFNGFVPRAYAVGTDLYAHFFNANGPASMSLVIHSANGGQAWRLVQQGVTAFAPGDRRNLHVKRTGDASTPGQQYAYVGAGYSVLGTGTPGTGGLVPALRLAGVSLLGNSTQLTIEQVPANTLGTMNLSFAPPVAFPFVGGTVYLQAPIATVVFASGTTGIGTVALPIPNSTALAGITVPAQALAIDVAANSGFSLSNAIEIWVR